MGKGRLEAFSDGVLAVAITLLVLDLRVDSNSPLSLGTQLGHEWPSFVAYLVSFFVIGIIWVNHHAMLAMAARVDRSLMFYNLLLLMWVVTIPFTTATLADFLRDGSADTRLAVLLYGASIEGMAISFVLMLRHLIRHDLLLRAVTGRQARMGLMRFGLGALLYPGFTVVGLFSPVAMLILYALLDGYYIVDQTPILPDEPDQA